MTSYSYQIEVSSVAVSGSDIIAFYFDALQATTGEFLLNAENQQASLLYSSVLEAAYDANAQYALSGSNANFAVTFKTAATTGDYALQGAPLTLTGSYELVTTPSTFLLSAPDLNVSKLYLLSQATDNSAAFALTGADLTSSQGRALQTLTGSFLLTGRDTTLRITNGRLVATRGFAGLTGYNLVTQYLASTALPSLRPTKREFVPPAYSINTTKSVNGLTYRRMFASLPSGAELRLTYENLPDADANTLLALYDTAQGTYRNLTLPAATMAGAEPELQAYLNLNGTDQKWTFANPPTLDSVAPGVHTVTLALRSRIVPPSSRVPLPSLPACEVAIPSTCYPYAGSGGGASLANVWFPPDTPAEPPPLETGPTPERVRAVTTVTTTTQTYTCSGSGAIAQPVTTSTTTYPDIEDISYDSFNSRIITQGTNGNSCDNFNTTSYVRDNGATRSFIDSGIERDYGTAGANTCINSTLTCQSAGTFYNVYKTYETVYEYGYPVVPSGCWVSGTGDCLLFAIAINSGGWPFGYLFQEFLGVTNLGYSGQGFYPPYESIYYMQARVRLANGTILSSTLPRTYNEMSRYQVIDTCNNCARTVP